MYCWNAYEQREDRGDKGLEKRWRTLDSVEGGQREEETKTRTERCKERKGMR